MSLTKQLEESFRRPLPVLRHNRFGKPDVLFSFIVREQGIYVGSVLGCIFHRQKFTVAGLEDAGGTASTLKKYRLVNVHAQLTVSVLYHSGYQPREWYHWQWTSLPTSGLLNQACSEAHLPCDSRSHENVMITVHQVRFYQIFLVSKKDLGKLR